MLDFNPQLISQSLLLNLFLFIVAILAGAINAIAGGGGLMTFPALIFAGIPAISANATSTAAMWVGTAASTFAYRRDMSLGKCEFLCLTAASVCGGIFGSYLLLHTSASNFANLIPYLMLTATVLFAFGKKFNAWLQSRFQIPIWFAILIQFAIAIYGGYFGGGGGILMLAILEIIGVKTIHSMNAIKSWLATSLNAFALLHFVLAGIIAWFPAILMAIGALIGGYGSAFFARKINSEWVRRFIIGIGVMMTCYFFVKL
jgi:uncharacterized protein